MGFFRSVPKEIEERALLDGATRLQMLRQVVIPVVLPGILTAAIFAFTLSFQGVHLRPDFHQLHGQPHDSGRDQRRDGPAATSISGGR